MSFKLFHVVFFGFMSVFVCFESSGRISHVFWRV